jgi:hypothetical protein
MRVALSILIGCAAVGGLLFSHGAAKEGTEPVTAPPLDPAPASPRPMTMTILLPFAAL